MSDSIKAFVFWIVLLGAIVATAYTVRPASSGQRHQVIYETTIYQDSKTGCQYVSKADHRASLTPRVDGNGKQLGCKQK